MAQTKLTARKVETAGPGKHEDGRGLRLVVSETGARKWVLRVMRAGKRVEMGLGGYPDVSLAEARDAAETARKLAKAGADPIAARKAARAASATGTAFGTFALALIDDLEGGFRNAKHRQQWRNTLDDLLPADLDQAARRHHHRRRARMPEADLDHESRDGLARARPD